MVLKILIPSWLGLGFYRGIKNYNYNYKRELIDYDKNKHINSHLIKKPKYFYSTSIGIGLFGVILYVNPLLLPFTITKEIYRIEVNIRGLNEEKESNEYYQFL